MKNIKNFFLNPTTLTCLFLFVSVSCERVEKNLRPATFPSIGEVFIDDFSPTLDWAPFAGSKPTALQVVSEDAFEGSGVLRFEVPDPSDSEGSFLGGTLHTTPRNLTGFNVLTFYARASIAASVNEIGFGLDEEGKDANKVTVTGLKLTPTWQKFYLPIPNPSRLAEEEGMFWISEGAEVLAPGGTASAYTIWIDELQFENLGTIGEGVFAIQNSKNGTFAYNGEVFAVSSLLPSVTATYSTPNGGTITENISKSYIDLESSNPGAFIIDGDNITVNETGVASITGKVNGIALTNAVEVTIQDFVAAPTPTQAAEDVVSIYSDTYTNVANDFLISNFPPFQATTGRFFESNGDGVLIYSNYNFVAMGFGSAPINASEMTNLSMDIYVPRSFDASGSLNVLVTDQAGATTEISINPNTSPALVTGSWIDLDIDISGMASKSAITEILFRAEGDVTPRPSEFVLDNVYFYKQDAPVGGKGELFLEDFNAATSINDWFKVANAVGNSNVTITHVADGGVDGSGAMLIKHTDAGGGAFIVQVDKTGLDFGGNTDLTITMDAKFEIAPVATALFWQTILPTNVSNQVDNVETMINAGTFTTITQEVTGINAGGNTFTVSFNMAGGAVAGATIGVFIDNIKIAPSTGGGSPTEPPMAAPTPPARNAADVISLFTESDVYTDVTVDTFRTPWSGGSTLEDVMIGGNQAKKYSDITFWGIETVGADLIDATSMTHLHMDIWTAADITEFGIELVDFGADEGFDGGDDTKFRLVKPITTGQWTSIDIPLTEFTGVNNDNIAQYVFSLQPTGTTIWLDNLYFYKQ